MSCAYELWWLLSITVRGWHHQLLSLIEIHFESLGWEKCSWCSRTCFYHSQKQFRCYYKVVIAFLSYTFMQHLSQWWI